VVANQGIQVARKIALERIALEAAFRRRAGFTPIKLLEFSSRQALGCRGRHRNPLQPLPQARTLLLLQRRKRHSACVREREKEREREREREREEER
jgi:hypothetical protein